MSMTFFLGEILILRDMFFFENFTTINPILGKLGGHLLVCE